MQDAGVARLHFDGFMTGTRRLGGIGVEFGFQSRWMTPHQSSGHMSKSFGVIFVSQRSSLRSILAQACLQHLGALRFTALACGQPVMIAETIHPAAIAALSSASIPVPVHPPRDWDDLMRTSARRAEFVITLEEATSAFQPK